MGVSAERTSNHSQQGLLRKEALTRKNAQSMGILPNGRFAALRSGMEGKDEKSN